MTYLADTSAIIRLRREHEIAPQWLDAIRAGLVGVCPVVDAELTRAVASKTDRDGLRHHLRSLFTWHRMPDSAWQFVERTQADLVGLGLRKGPSVVDLLVAATAQAWGLTVLHVDADFDTIAQVTDLATQRADR
ncbi:MAG: PIN domain-containing protein [Micromonosporaceae bacterium]|nr:PIN domain-containing protein [Micromonosporaceae bacterium]